MNWETGTGLYTLLCILQITSENLPWGARSSARCSVGTWEGNPKKRGYMCTGVRGVLSRRCQWQRIGLPMQKPQETCVRSLGREDLVEEGMATHPGILAWRIPWTEEPCGLQSAGSQRVGHD